MSAHHLSPLARVLRILEHERRDLAAVFFYALCVGVLSLAVPISASAVVNSVALTTLVQQLVVLCSALAIALALAALLQTLQLIVVEYVQRRVFIRVAGELAHLLPRVELRAFDRQHGPELVNRFFDVLTVQKAAAMLLMDGIALALQILIGLVLLATYDRILLGFDVLLVVGFVILVFGLGRHGVATAIEESIAKYDVAAWLEELVRHPLAFKSAGGPSLAHERTEQLTQTYLTARAGHFRVLLRQIGFGFFMQVVASVALLGIGGYLVMDGHLTLGQLVAAQIIVNLVVSSFGKLGKQLESWYDLMAAADKVGHLLDLPPEREGGQMLAHGPQGMAVTVRELDFQHEGSPTPTFRNFSFELTAGERVAIVGGSGAGKSTLVELLFGLRRPGRGWIEIDGVDLRDLSLVSLREQMCVVQGVEVLESSLAANVLVGREELTLHAVREALAAVGLLDDVLLLTDGLDTVLTAGGSPLSRGQVERLMLARALVGRPRLLVLDESLDALDAMAAECILPLVFDPARPWTLLVVTHDASVAARCGRRILVEKGNS